MPHAFVRALGPTFLLTIAAAAAVAAAPASPVPTSSPAPVPTATGPQTLAWRLSPSTKYAETVRLTHVVSNDLSGMLKTLAGANANPTTILEDRAITLTAGSAPAIALAIVDSRRYGGDHPKSAAVVTRPSSYDGTMAADGQRTPSDEPLIDPGDGALAQLPGTPIAPGQSWTFSRAFLVDRDLGQGRMTYTDTFERAELRGGHVIAVIGVSGAGRADVTKDLQAKGFQTSDITLQGTGEFDVTSGLPGAQHYTAHVKWETHVLWVHLGLFFDDTFDAVPWSVTAK